jgi:uncharacterized membrane protein
MTLKDFSITLADKIATFIGSWTFIIIQSTILTIWVTLNLLRVWNFDSYPFILLNLFLSFEAAYATPLILMSSNRTADRDRAHMLKDLELDQEDHIIITELVTIINEVHKDLKIDRLLLQQHEVASSERAKILELLKEVKERLK